MYEENKKLLRELGLLHQEKEDLDMKLKLEVCDQLTMQRLKRQKTVLETKISMIEAIVYPDIIA